MQLLQEAWTFHQVAAESSVVMAARCLLQQEEGQATVHVARQVDEVCPDAERCVAPPELAAVQPNRPTAAQPNQMKAARHGQEYESEADQLDQQPQGCAASLIGQHQAAVQRSQEQVLVLGVCQLRKAAV